MFKLLTELNLVGGLQKDVDICLIFASMINSEDEGGGN